MSDLFYQSNEYLARQVSYHKQKQNEHAMKAKAAQDELNRRSPEASRPIGVQEALEKEIRTRLLNGDMRLYPYQADMAREIVSSANAGFIWTKVARGTGRTIIKVAVDLLRDGHILDTDGSFHTAPKSDPFDDFCHQCDQGE